MLDSKQAYRFWNSVAEVWLPGHITTSRAHALRWAVGSEPYMQVVRLIPGRFGEVIARGDAHRLAVK